jgi:2-polyprenyl-3-methyl-5-hydroxy-6-metoxy-1,4-benzoquinol methylase
MPGTSKPVLDAVSFGGRSVATKMRLPSRRRELLAPASRRSVGGVSDERFEYWDQGRDEVVPFVPRHAERILDIGCAAGGFGRSLLRNMPNAVLDGIEADEEAASRAEGSYRRVYRGLFPAVTPDGQYDVVVCNDVLEHMIDPWTAVHEIRKLLRADGIVVASLPNMRHHSALFPLLRGRWDYGDHGVLDRTHLRWFTRATMRELFEGAGFRVTQLQKLTGFEPSTAPWRLAKALAPRTTADILTKQYVVVASPRPRERDTHA